MKLTFIFFAILIMLTSAVSNVAAQKNEFAPLQEKELKYNDWTFKSLQDGQPVNLRAFATGKKLVLVTYYAPWCPNWKNEMPVIDRLYAKYKSQGFDVIAVNEYGSLDEARQVFGGSSPAYTVVVETEAREDLEKATLFDYRKKTGDTRRWGSPWNIFLEPATLSKKGDTLVKKAFVVNGELIETEVETFIRQKLGLSAESAKQIAAAADAAQTKVSAQPAAKP